MNRPGATAEASAAEVLLSTLRARGVEHFFGNAGTDFPSIIEAFAKAEATGEPVPVPVTVPHENLGIAMAHGAYLATGRPQAIMLHVNVGTANAICGLVNAARDNVPIFLCSGRTPIREDGAFGARSVFIHWGQEMFDQAGMLRELVKWDYELRDAGHVASVVERALALAMSDPRGPIYLTLPREVLAREADVPAAGSPPRLVPAAPPAPDPLAIELAARMIAAAERPVVVTASYGREPGDVAVLGDLAEQFAIPVVGHQPRYLFLPTDHPMQFGIDPSALVGDADLVLVVECDVPWIPTQHRANPAAKVIHLGVDPLFARYPMRSFPVDLAITARPAAGLAALADALAVLKPDVAARRVRLAAQQTARRETAATLRERALASGRITMPVVAAALERVVGPGDRVVCEPVALMGLMRFTEPGSYFGTSPAGGLGWGLGAALGLKLGDRSRRVIAAVGDGSYMFGNPTPAHMVAAAHDLPTLTLVLNNRMWGAVRRATLGLYPDGHAARTNRAALTFLEPSPAYEKVVAASDGYGERVEEAKALPGALDRALAELDRGRQAVLNVLVEYGDQDARAPR